MVGVALEAGLHADLDVVWNASVVCLLELKNFDYDISSEACGF
jgi:hypothetical protein